MPGIQITGGLQYMVSVGWNNVQNPLDLHRGFM